METSCYTSEFTSTFYIEEDIIRFYKMTIRRHLNFKVLLTENFTKSETEQSDNDEPISKFREDDFG